LAAALLFPAVAAIHGITLAAVHTNGMFIYLHVQSTAISLAIRRLANVFGTLGAVDMDIYGAFQLCSIGILAAPVTVRLSQTYFYDPGRNNIFLWIGLILAGE
jgi:hypothetical protein